MSSTSRARSGNGSGSQLSHTPTSSSRPMPSVAIYGVAPGMDAEIGVSMVDMYDKMRRIENDGRIFCTTARYIPYRRLLVDWICECGEAHRLHNSTQHVAVGYMDKALQIFHVHDERLQAVAMACLLIAAKYEEKEEACPTAPMLVSYAANELSRDAASAARTAAAAVGTPDAQMAMNNAQAARERRAPTAGLIHQMEVLLLNRLNWSLTIVAPLHYLGMLHRKGIVFETDTLGYKPLRPTVLRYLVKYTDFFADLCLQDYSFNTYSPSILAAGMVLAARRALNIVPTWNPALEDVLKYTEEEVSGVYQAVWAYYAVCFPAKVKEANEQAETTLRDAIERGVVVVMNSNNTMHNSSAAASPAAHTPNNRSSHHNHNNSQNSSFSASATTTTPLNKSQDSGVESEQQNHQEGVEAGGSSFTNGLMTPAQAGISSNGSSNSSNFNIGSAHTVVNSNEKVTSSGGGGGGGGVSSSPFTPQGAGSLFSPVSSSSSASVYKDEISSGYFSGGAVAAGASSETKNTESSGNGATSRTGRGGGGGGSGAGTAQDQSFPQMNFGSLLGFSNPSSVATAPAGKENHATSTTMDRAHQLSSAAAGGKVQQKTAAAHHQQQQQNGSTMAGVLSPQYK